MTKRCVMSQLTNAQFSGLSDPSDGRAEPGVSVELGVTRPNSSLAPLGATPISPRPLDVRPEQRHRIPEIAVRCSGTVATPRPLRRLWCLGCRLIRAVQLRRGCQLRPRLGLADLVHAPTVGADALRHLPDDRLALAFADLDPSAGRERIFGLRRFRLRASGV